MADDLFAVDPITGEPLVPLLPAIRDLARAALHVPAVSVGGPPYLVAAAKRPGTPAPPGWELLWREGQAYYRRPIAGGWQYADVRDAWLAHLTARRPAGDGS